MDIPTWAISTSGRHDHRGGHGGCYPGDDKFGYGAINNNNSTTLNAVGAAIRSSSANGIVGITNSGTITTPGATSPGIIAASTNGTMTITNDKHAQLLLLFTKKTGPTTRASLFL